MERIRYLLFAMPLRLPCVFIGKLKKEFYFFYSEMDVV